MIRFLQTQGPTKKIVLGGLLLLICGAMVVTFIPGVGQNNSLLGGPGKGVIAKVDGNDITADEVRTTARQMAQQQAAQYGEMANRIMPILMQQAVPRAADQLVMRAALISQAGHMGLKVTPAEIQDELQHGRYSSTFFPGGSFVGQSEYESMLARFNLTPQTFEDSVGKEILISKLEALISGSASVGEGDIRTQFIKQNTKVKFDYAVLKQDDLKKGIHPAEEELKSYYESHKQQYANSVPEKRKIKYVVVDQSKMGSNVQITRTDLETYYNAHRDQYRVPEQVKVSHILIKTPLPGADGKVDEKGVATAQSRAEDILKQIKGGAKFEDLAKKYSEDPGSGKEGGSLGWIGKGRTVPEFEKTAFSLPKGQMSDLVKSSYGFHIIRVDDKQEAKMKTLDEVKGEIEPILKQQKGQQLAQQEAEAILAQAKGAAGLDGAKGPALITSDFFSRKDMLPGVGPAPQVMDAVFAAAEKSPPQMTASSQGFVVFQLLAIKPAATPTLDEIRNQVEEQFKNERSNVLLAQKVQELSDRAKAAHDLKKAAMGMGAAVKTSDLVLPDGQVPDLGSMTGQASVAFNMKPGEISGPINEGGNGVVISLLQKDEPSEADFAAKRDDIRDQLLQGKRQQLFGLFISNLREQMEKSGKIKINQDEMKQLSGANNTEGM